MAKIMCRQVAKIMCRLTIIVMKALIVMIRAFILPKTSLFVWLTKQHGGGNIKAVINKFRVDLEINL